MTQCKRKDLLLTKMDNHEANRLVTEKHYLKRPIYVGRNVSYRVEHKEHEGFGVIMYGYPVFHTKYWLVGKEEPLRNGELVELCRIWLPNEFPKNSESCAISKSIVLLKQNWADLHRGNGRRWLPIPKAIISFADAEHYHEGTIYKASNFHYLGWVKGRKATPGKGQGRWANAKKGGYGQVSGIKKNVYLRVLDTNAGIDLTKLRTTYNSA